jgi:hypothetical protein
MKQLLHAFRHLTRRQKLAVAIMVAVIFLTWLAVCLVFVIPTG